MRRPETSSSSPQPPLHLNLILNICTRRCKKITGNVKYLVPMRKLEVLKFAETSVSGDLSSLGTLRQLTVLDLTYTQVKGQIGDLGSCRMLVSCVGGSTHSVTKMC